MAAQEINTAEIWSTSLQEIEETDVDHFKCSDEPGVEDFLKREAWELEESSACKTHLFFYKDTLIGYFTLFTDYVNIVKSKRHSKETWKKMKTAMPRQCYPAIRLHYIGVDERFRDQGLGELLLLFAMDTCVEVSQHVGFSFVVLEALDSSCGFFEKQNFEKIKTHEEDKRLTIMAIKLQDIKEQFDDGYTYEEELED